MEPNIPFDIEAEQTILGVCLNDPKRLDQLDHMFGEYFYEPLHGRIFKTMKRLHRTHGHSWTAEDVRFELRDDEMLRLMPGTRNYVFELMEYTGPGAYEQFTVNTRKVEAMHFSRNGRSVEPRAATPLRLVISTKDASL